MGLPSIQLGPYQLHERIGEGGNGAVYRATGPTGTVAIKLIGSASDFDDAALARFRRETAALGELSHPFLIPLLDHGVDAELGPYLVLPLLAGRTLRELCRGRALCPEAALLLVLPIAEATAALHAGGYVHRDLKPENAIATPDGTITVIDLGLAWGEGMSRHTESGAAVGSVGYMAPEQLDGRTVDASADVWALGVMLYEHVAGKRPFARTRPTEEVAATLLGAYSRLTAADRRAGEELAELVARCLAIDPANRPGAGELAGALRAQIDWVALDELAAERAAVIADPVGYQARIATFRVRRLERLAREAIDAGKPFSALASCDRGLVYAPEHPALLALIASAEPPRACLPEPLRAAPGEDRSGRADAHAADSVSTGDAAPGEVRDDRSAPAAPAAQAGARAVRAADSVATGDAARGDLRSAADSVTTGDAAPGDLRSAATAARAADSVSTGDARHDSGDAPRAAVAAEAAVRRTSPRTAVIASAATAVAIGAIFLIASRTSKPDPWASPGPTVTTTQASTIDDRDRALLRDFVGVFNTAMESSGRAPATPAGQRPTTASGWLELARSQAPAEAVTSLRHALRLNPGWPAAQDALCVALAAIDDDGTVELCTKAIARRPAAVDLRAARGAALVRSQRAVEALADLDVVVAADPAPIWRRMRAGARSAAGDDAGAAQDLAHACQLGDALACQAKR